MDVGKVIAINDILLNDIMSNIDANNINMLNNYENVKKSKSKNEFLELICEEYSEYFDKIILEKEKQIEHLNSLLGYLNKENEKSKENENVSKFLENSTIIKNIYIKNRLVNFITKK